MGQWNRSWFSVARGARPARHQSAAAPLANRQPIASFLLTGFRQIGRRELLVIELRVQPAARKQLLMPPDVYDTARFEYDDLIGAQHGRQTMCDDNRRAILE